MTHSRTVRLLSAATIFAATILGALLGLVRVPQFYHLLADRGFLATAVYAAELSSDEKEYALIFGTVWGPDNRPIYGVPIKIRRATEKKARWEQMSDHRGEFAQRVPAGKAEYVVWADIKTPKGKEKPQVKVAIENDERADISLHLTE